MKRILLTLSVLATLVAPRGAHAQFNQVWNRTHDGGLNLSDDPTNMAVDAEGNSFVVGTINSGMTGNEADIAVFKYDANGTLLWRKVWNGPAGTQDIAFGMALAPDGAVIAVGRTNTVATSSDYVTLKYATDGTLLWARLYDGPASSIDQALAAGTDAAGNVFVVGEVYNDAEMYINGDFCTLKYDAQGNLLWSRLYDGPANYINTSDQPRCLAVDANGDVIVSGDSPDINLNARIATLKYRGSDGQLLWLNRSEDAGISGYQVALEAAPNKDVILGLNSQDFGLQVVLSRLDSTTGHAIWTVRDSFPHGGRLKQPKSMALDRQGNPVISVTYDPDNDNSNLNYNIQTSKYAFSTGSRAWSVSTGTTARYDGQGASAVTTDRDGNVIVAGQNLVVPHTRLALWQFRATDGALQWATDFAFPKDSDIPERVVLDGFGNLLVTGETKSNNTIYLDDLFIAKYQRVNFNLNPRTAIVTDGEWFKGDLTSLEDSDDVTYQFFESPETLLGRLVLESPAPITSPASFRIQFEYRVSRPGLTASLELYTNVGAHYVSVMGESASQSDQIRELTLSSNLGQYVVDGMLRARLTFMPINDEDPAQDGWLHHIDRFAWLIGN